MTDTITTSSDPSAPPISPEHATAVRNWVRSLDVLERAIRTADPARWDGPSPCAEWTARQVAGHAMHFLTNVVQLADEGPDPDFFAEVDPVEFAGDDPSATWTAVRHRIETELLQRPDRLVNVRLTPLGVEMPVVDLLLFQGMDPVVHAWDVATATGGIVDIPDDLATDYRARFAPVGEVLRESGRLGPETEPIGDGPVGELLGFCGRVQP
jgi:uncharacterized protein (TIGR03086 family)